MLARSELFVRMFILGMGIGLGLLCALFIFMALSSFIGAFMKRNNANKN